MLPTLGRLAFFASAGLLGLFALVYEPERKPDHKNYEQCIKLHPQRYCAIEHLHHR
jgi:hypothetical protein